MYKFQELIKNWANDRGLVEESDPKSQCLKTVSEVGELCDALLHENEVEIKDAIGDIMVTLAILCEMKGYTLYDCAYGAYDIIKNRKGKMINGTFKKE